MAVSVLPQTLGMREAQPLAGKGRDTAIYRTKLTATLQVLFPYAHKYCIQTLALNDIMEP